jgi:hypothetical protein
MHFYPLNEVSPASALRPVIRRAWERETGSLIKVNACSAALFPASVPAASLGAVSGPRESLGNSGIGLFLIVAGAGGIGVHSPKRGFRTEATDTIFSRVVDV